MARWARMAVCGLVAWAFIASSQAEAGLWRWRGASPVYRGYWESDTNGHRGRLRMRVVETGCHTYRVRFSGTFLGVVPFVYSTPLTVTGRTCDGGVALYGHSRLPLFGNFTSHATMNPCGFSATYTSGNDRGRFVMRRKS